jgi:hypothetical protein
MTKVPTGRNSEHAAGKQASRQAGKQAVWRTTQSPYELKMVDMTETLMRFLTNDRGYLSQACRTFLTKKFYIPYVLLNKIAGLCYV